MSLDKWMTNWDVARVSDFIGIIGVLLVLACYFLLQLGMLSLRSFTFSFFNFLGSIFLLFSLFFHWNLASVIIEVAWLLISLYGMIRYFCIRKRDKKSRHKNVG